MKNSIKFVVILSILLLAVMPNASWAAPKKSCVNLRQDLNQYNVFMKIVKGDVGKDIGKMDVFQLKDLLKFSSPKKITSKSNQIDKPSAPIQKIDRPTGPKQKVEKPPVSVDKPAVPKQKAEKPPVTVDKPAVPKQKAEKPPVSVDKPAVPKQKAEKPPVSVDKPAVPKQKAEKPPVSVDKPAAPIDNGPTIVGYEKQIVDLVNKERAAQGLTALKYNANLSEVAKLKALDMKEKNYFSHTSPTYGSPFDMMRSMGIKYTSAGENIAKGYRTPDAVMKGWMNSPGHKANILNSNFTEIGIGYVTDSSGAGYWVQMFIRP